MTTRLELHGASIEIAPGSLATLGQRIATLHPGHRVAIVADQTVAHLHGAKAIASLVTEGLALGSTQGGTVAPAVFTFPAGEQHKTRDTWASLTDKLIAAGLRRDSVLIALGGGVTGDLTGFIAATFLRGVPFVQVPTSLLAMIDAAIGGKTGVDTSAGKNLVGAFHQPSLVLVDPTLLRTLPTVHLRGGLAEAIKHGVIADASYFSWITASLREILHGDQTDDATFQRLVQRSIEIKVEIVASDEREAGRRKHLNFGHTLGHAIEHVTGYGVPHGDAVAIGMVAEAMLAERIGVAEKGTADTIATVCDAAGLPVRLPDGLAAAEVVTATRTDKKTRGGKVEYALPESIGRMSASDKGFAIAVPEPDVLRTLQHL
ncbi:MAG: 3-dehydroquinate synthase [Gemmatimonadaceae bacterium]|nr:3-dehydroquinate synthase [Gemmatimonadaceae bacterium]